MDIVCAWCGKSLPSKGEISPAHTNQVSHGMCEECFDLMSEETGKSLTDFLQSLDVPVLLVSWDAEVMFSENPENYGLPSGEIFECAHARLPDGCGKTEHCVACTIRTAVEETTETGNPVIARQGYQHLRRDGIEERVPVIVWTAKGKEGVILRVEERSSIDA